MLVGGTGLRAARAECIGLRAAGAHFLQSPSPGCPPASSHVPRKIPIWQVGRLGRRAVWACLREQVSSVAEASSFLAGWSWVCNLHSTCCQKGPVLHLMLCCPILKFLVGFHKSPIFHFALVPANYAAVPILGSHTQGPQSSLLGSLGMLRDGGGHREDPAHLPSTPIGAETWGTGHHLPGCPGSSLQLSEPTAAT